MNPVKTVLLAITLTCAPAFGADATIETVSVADIASLSDSDWTGTLTYLDYGSNRPTEIPVTIQFAAATSKSIRYTIRYPDEPQHNESAKLKVSRRGQQLNGDVVVGREELPDGTMVLVTESRESDDGRPADVRTTYSIGANALSIRKEVRFDETAEYFERNAYRFTR